MTLRMAAEQAARTCKTMLKFGCAVVIDENNEYAVCVCDECDCPELGVMAWIPGGQRTIAGGVREIYRQMIQVPQVECGEVSKCNE